MRVYVYDIDWCTEVDGEEDLEAKKALPTQVTLDADTSYNEYEDLDGYELNDFITNALSGTYGWLVYGYECQVTDRGPGTEK